MTVKGNKIRFKLLENEYIRPYPWPSTTDFLPALKKQIYAHTKSKEDIAFAVQQKTERIVFDFVEHFLKKYPVKHLVLAGGVFSNVKLNQKLTEFKSLESVYVHPAMTDAGLTLGSAFYSFARSQDFTPSRLNDVYFGPGFSDAMVENELEKFSNEVIFEKVKNAEKEIAQLLHQDKVVGRFNGRMEYGPRALGNRSILYAPHDPKVNDWLNKRLNRTEFMPFAPSALANKANELYVDYEKGVYTAEFMTMAFEVTDFAKKEAAAVTHVDGTARPQLVSKKHNASYFEIISAYEKQSGIPCIVNTSFNMHEEPIVCTPHHAIRSFLDGRLDVLAIHDFIAARK